MKKIIIGIMMSIFYFGFGFGSDEVNMSSLKCGQTVTANGITMGSITSNNAGRSWNNNSTANAYELHFYKGDSDLPINLIGFNNPSSSKNRDDVFRKTNCVSSKICSISTNLDYGVLLEPCTYYRVKIGGVGEATFITLGTDKVTTVQNAPAQVSVAKAPAVQSPATTTTLASNSNLSCGQTVTANGITMRDITSNNAGRLWNNNSTANAYDVQFYEGDSDQLIQLKGNNYSNVFLRSNCDGDKCYVSTYSNYNINLKPCTYYRVKIGGVGEATFITLGTDKVTTVQNAPAQVSVAKAPAVQAPATTTTLASNSNLSCGQTVTANGITIRDITINNAGRLWNNNSTANAYDVQFYEGDSDQLIQLKGNNYSNVFLRSNCDGDKCYVSTYSNYNINLKPCTYYRVKIGGVGEATFITLGTDKVTTVQNAPAQVSVAKAPAVQAPATTITTATSVSKLSCQSTMNGWCVNECKQDSKKNRSCGKSTTSQTNKAFTALVGTLKKIQKGNNLSGTDLTRFYYYDSANNKYTIYSCDQKWVVNTKNSLNVFQWQISCGDQINKKWEEIICNKNKKTAVWNCSNNENLSDKAIKARLKDPKYQKFSYGVNAENLKDANLYIKESTTKYSFYYCNENGFVNTNDKDMFNWKAFCGILSSASNASSTSNALSASSASTTTCSNSNKFYYTYMYGSITPTPDIDEDCDGSMNNQKLAPSLATGWAGMNYVYKYTTLNDCEASINGELLQSSFYRKNDIIGDPTSVDGQSLNPTEDACNKVGKSKSHDCYYNTELKYYIKSIVDKCKIRVLNLPEDNIERNYHYIYRANKSKPVMRYF